MPAWVILEANNEPGNVGRAFGKTSVHSGSLREVHVFPLSSSASRWVNIFKNAENFPSKEHTESFNSRTDFANGPKHALIVALWRAMNDIAERVSELRLINAVKWVSARRSASSKGFDGVWGYVNARWRDVTWEESRDGV